MKKIFSVLLCVLLLAVSVSPDQTQVSPGRIVRVRANTEAGGGEIICTGPNWTEQIGANILARGGSAIDAAIASALSYITLDIGQIVSFAGIFLLVYYEAATGKVYSLNACFKTVREEDSPLTIPSRGIPNARAVLVPGFMAGAQEAHNRFGRLPWAELFAPAIDLAENGFLLTSGKLRQIQEHWNVLGALPETRNIFLKRPYGLFRHYRAGDTFIQSELAFTLRQVASQGAAYMYTGDWGRKLVDIVRREGGKLTHRDMEEYAPFLGDPTHTPYNGYDIHALGYPSSGSMSVVLGINLMDCAGLAGLPHYQNSIETLYRLIYCSRVGELFYAPYAPEIITSHIPQGDFTYGSLHKKETARLIWEQIESGQWSAVESHVSRDGFTRPSHSEAIVVRDAFGNVAAVCHTINSDFWGNSGIFIDGVSIPGAGFYQQFLIDKIGPGQYLPDTTNPLLILQNGLPVIASSSIGSNMHSSTVQNLYNLIHFGMTMSESRARPRFQAIEWGSMNQKIRNNTFSQTVIDALRARGLGITLVDNPASEYWIGLWIEH